MLATTSGRWDWVQAWGPVIAAVVTGFVAVYALSAQRKREHERWQLQERKGAYVNFLEVSRATYEDIDRLAKRPPGNGGVISVQEGYLRGELATQIEAGLGKVKHAALLIGIVGPEELRILAQRAEARLRVDRTFFRPTLQLTKPSDGEWILRNTEAAGDRRLTEAVRKAIAANPTRGELYEALQTKRLDDFWEDFEAAARKQMDIPTRRWIGRAVPLAVAAAVGAVVALAISWLF